MDENKNVKEEMKRLKKVLQVWTDKTRLISAETDELYNVQYY